MKALKYLACLASALGIVSTALANSFTFVTPSGATDSVGEPVSAQAIFNTSGDMLSITLNNLIVNQKSVGQNISDLEFTLSNVDMGGSLTSSSGLERTVASNGTFTDGAVVATGWALSVDAFGTFHLDGLGVPSAPTHTILGAPDGTNVYSNANNSITGNGPHNPFLVGDVVFNLAIAGIDANTIVTGATFSFGTTAGDNVPGGPGVPTPDSGTTVGLLGGALILLGTVRRWLKGSFDFALTN